VQASQLGPQPFELGDVAWPLSLTGQKKEIPSTHKKIGDACMLPCGDSHAGKHQVEVVLQQILNQAAVNGRLQIAPSPARPFESEVTHKDGIAPGKLADRYDRLPPWANTRFSLTPWQNALGTDNRSANACGW
jgi:hypothetical protein